jgi:membrane protein DedA with SNARE-associated domain
MGTLADLISTHGYWIVGAVIGLESMGLPLPGETMLITAAIYAGTSHQLSIEWVIAAAAIGAIVGDNVGFLIGRTFGYRLVLRHGHKVGLNARRIKLGQYLFQRHGGKVVFAGRFVAVLRALAAVLAGINRMSWWRFLVFNATGGIVWTTLYGLAAYKFGEQVEKVSGPVAIVGVILAIAVSIALLRFVRHHEMQFEAEAEKALPDVPADRDDARPAL